MVYFGESYMRYWEELGKVCVEIIPGIGGRGVKGKWWEGELKYDTFDML
jgi:hypothetical protein